MADPNDPWKLLDSMEQKTANQTDPWSQLDALESTPVQAVTPIQQKPSIFHDIQNRVKNIGTIIGAGVNYGLGNTLNPTQSDAIAQLSKAYHANDDGQVSDKVLGDITHMFSKASITDTAKSLWGSLEDKVQATKDHPVDAVVGGVGTMLSLPYKMIESMAGSVSGSITGVSLSGDTVRALAPEEQADKVKSLIGNGVAAITFPLVEKAIGAALTAGAPTETAALAAYTPKLGPIGRGMLEDLGAGTAAGVAQGAITEANKAEILTGMATGLLFAPLGVAFGYLRGIKGGLGDLEIKINDAKSIMAVRNMQNIVDANIDGAARKVSTLLMGETIDKALNVPDSYIDIKNLGQPLTPDTPAALVWEDKLSGIPSYVSTSSALPGRAIAESATIGMRSADKIVKDVVNLKSTSSADLESHNKWAMSELRTGQPITYYGFRAERGTPVPGTGRFYGITREYAQLYNPETQNLKVHKLEFENPLRLDGGHLQIYEGILQQEANAKWAFDEGNYSEQRAAHDYEAGPEDGSFPSYNDWYKERHGRLPDDKVRVGDLVLTPTQAAQYKAAGKITYNRDKVYEGLGKESGYGLMDKILTKVAKENGYDALIFDKDHSEIVDLTGKARANRTVTTTVESGTDLPGVRVNPISAPLPDGTLVSEIQVKPITIPKQDKIFVPGDNSPKTVGDLYSQFKSTLNRDETFTTSLVNFAEKNNLTPHLNELGMKFSEMYYKENVPLAELDHLEKLQAQIQSQDLGPFEMHQEALHVKASQSGFYMTNNHGALEIRDMGTGMKMGTAHTSEEAFKFIEDSGRVPNPMQLDAGAKVPGLLVDIPIGPHVSINMKTEFEPIVTNVNRLMAYLSGTKLLSPFTGIRAWSERIDTQTSIPTDLVPEKGFAGHIIRASHVTPGTDLKHSFVIPTEHEVLMTSIDSKRNMNHPVVKALNNAVLRDKITATDREIASHIVETSTIVDMMKPNGHVMGHTPIEASFDLAKHMTDNSVDNGLVLNYRTALTNAKYDAMQEARTSARETLDWAHMHGSEDFQMIEAYQKDKGKFENLPSYQTKLAQIEQAYKPDANFMEAVNQYDKLYEMPDGVNHASLVGRLKMALDDPTHYGLSKEDYIKTHNVRPEVVALAQLAEKAYDHFGTQFGVKGSGKGVMRFMNHYRQIGDISNALMQDEFDRGIMDPGLRQFASAMSRSGEIANYNKDILANVYSYIQGGSKMRLYKYLEKVEGPGGVIDSELRKVTDTNIKKEIRARTEAYVRDITGQQDMDAKFALSNKVHYLKNVVLDENGKRYTAQEIIDKVNRPDMTSTILNFSSAGLLGGRVSLAFRDALDVFQKFGIRNGGKRLNDLLWTKVEPHQTAELIRNGDIVEQTPADRVDIMHGDIEPSGEGARVFISKLGKDAAELGFKMSLQHPVFMRNQAAVFLESMNHITNVLKDLKADKLTKEVAYDIDHIFINKFDTGTQRIFDAYVRSDQFESAARLLAREEVVNSAGRMTRGNQAPIVSSGPGRFLGQMASWGMANRTVLENMLTRGTGQEVMRSNVRYATSQAAILAAQSVTGLNLGRWMFLPTSNFATGGPVLSGIQAGVSAITASASDDQRQMNPAMRALGTAGAGLVPFSYAAKDLGKGIKLATQGSGYGAMRPIAQAFGIGVNSTNRNMLDIITGNYPTQPPPNR